MVLLERLKDAGTLAKFAFIAMLVTALFTWIAFTCPGWGGYNRKTEPYEVDGEHFGLWRSCSDDKYSPSCTRLDGWALEWFMAFQAFVTLAFLGVNLSLLFIILYIFVPSYQRNGELGKAAAFLCCISAALYMIGVIIFAVKYRRDYIDSGKKDFIFDYCFFLSIIAILLDGASGVFMFLDARLNGRETQQQQQQRAPPTGCQSNPTYAMNVPAGTQQSSTVLMVSSGTQQVPVGYQTFKASSQENLVINANQDDVNP